MKISKYYFICIIGLLLIVSYQLKAEKLYDNYYFLNSDFNKVLSLDNNIIIIVGTNGAVLRSSDKGVTWSHNFSGTHKDLYDIAKIDSNKLIIVGKSGTILRSDNKGLSWTVSSLSTSNDLKTVSFYNNQFGIIAGLNGKIFKSSNGGISWDSISSLGKNCFVSSYIYNSNIMFLADIIGNIYATSDAGLTWIKYSNNGIKYSVKNFAKDENNKIYLLTNSAIFSTMDLGITWEKMNINSWFNYAPQWISDFKNNKALALSYMIDYYNYINSSTVIDNDGEISVNKIINNCDSLYPVIGSLFVSASFIDSLNGFAVGTHNTIFVTNDGASSWKILSYYDNYYKQSKGSIYFLNKYTGFIGSYYEKIFRTNNGGTTWLPQKKDTFDVAESYIYGLYFTDINNGIGISDGFHNYFETKDGGESFYRKELSVPSYILDLCFLSDSSYIVAGYVDNGSTKTSFYESGRAEIIINKGDTCKYYKLNDTTVFSSCSIIKNGTYLFTGLKSDSVGYDYFSNSHSFFLKTSDNGITWKTQDIDFVNSVQKLHFIDSNTGFLIGSTPLDHTYKNYIQKIFKTTDAGISWYPVLLDTSTYFCRNINFNKSDTGYIVGLNVIWKTTDRGDSWIKYIDNDCNNHQLEGVFTADNSTYIVGDSNIVLKSIDKDNYVSVTEELNSSNSNLLYIYEPFPNPVINDAINFKFAWNNNYSMPNLTIKICNVLGETVADLTNYGISKINSNLGIIQWTSTGISPGVYYILFQANGYSRAKTFVIGD